VRKIALAAVVALVAIAVVTTYRLAERPSTGRLSTADARAVMQTGRLQDIGWRSTAGQKGMLGDACREQVHGVIRRTLDRDSRVSMWVCDTAADAQDIANAFPASMPGLASAPAGMGRRPGIDVSSQDNVLLWVAAPQASLAYETAEHLRDLLGERAGSAS